VIRVTNLRGQSINSLAPIWKAAGVTHHGDPVLKQYGKALSTVVFGNVKGHDEWVTYPDYQGVGNDYTVTYSYGTYPAYKLRIKLWFNGGTGGGTRQAGDGDRYCDMRGKGAGKKNSHTLCIANTNKNQTTTSGWQRMEPYWTQYGEVYKPGLLMVGHTRKDVHLVDRELLRLILVASITNLS
jgi:hypothetical protein